MSSTIDKSIRELREMDALADQESFVHSLHPLAKLLTTVFYILTVVSFHKYSLSALSVMILYPVMVFQISGISPAVCFRKLRFALPLVCAVGILNPFFDRQILFQIGSVPVSGGAISMLTLMLKGVLCLTASFLLAATTRMDSICAALRMLHVPSMAVTLLLLTFRYITLMAEEVSVMSQAYALRAPGQRGIHYTAWGSFLGQLLLRSMDRAEELYSSMQLRGFSGEFPYAKAGKPSAADFLWILCWSALFVFCRNVNVAALLGSLMLRGQKDRL